MSKAGYPYDNAQMERYYNTLKCELIYIYDYHCDEKLNTSIEEFAYGWYNHASPIFSMAIKCLMKYGIIYKIFRF